MSSPTEPASVIGADTSPSDGAEHADPGLPRPTASERWRRGVLVGGPTAGVVFLLVALATHRYLRLANADALLPALISTQRLTFFYWGQDRLASLVPAIAWPIRDPVWNFRFQMVVYGAAFFTLTAMFVWYHLHTTGRRVGAANLAVATAVAGLLVMAPMRAGTGNTLVFEQVYALSAVLFLCGGRWLVNASPGWRGRRWIGSLLILLAVLLNPSTLLYAPALLLLDDRRDGAMKRFAVGLGVIASSFLLGTLASRAFFDGESLGKYYSDFSTSRAHHGLDAAISNVLGSIDLSVACILGVACAAVVVWRWTSLPTRLHVAYIGTAVFGLVWLVIFSANRWVEINLFSYRYFFPLYASGMLVLAGTAAEVVALAQRAIEKRDHSVSPRPALQLLCVCTFVAVGVGGIVLATDRTQVHTLVAADDEVELAKRRNIRLIAGDYWSTWPTVVAGRAEGVDLLGVAYRSDPIADDINDEVDRSLSAAGVVRALCPSGDDEQCTREIASFTHRQWSATPLSDEGPLVLELHPVP
jgi:hypothetical protein